MANTIIVKNITELDAANKNASPGDSIILQNGEWKDVTIKLDCSGTKEKPIVFKAQSPGKVWITGHSQLKLGGSFIVVDGLYFTNGHAGDNTAVIDFRINKDRLANNCRVTNCAINDFNNPKRMDENNWVLFYGKNNRLDHCSFKDKKNMGVLLAVILDDERSRENFHSIDHNYFGRRPPLASNGGEILRVGVSQHCQFNSNTEISGNFFEECDGETEIISIKSGSNIIRKNIFKESQGSVVLRHGDNNLVEKNIFVGNDKTATGGVRVINKGQKVIGNIFYKCRGANFKAPLAVMNGIPNSPANRYVQVTDAEISRNIFYESSPLSFCEGSDTERSLPPSNVQFDKNVFYNTRDSIIYTVSDDIGGFKFANNTMSRDIKQDVTGGFEKKFIASANQKPAKNTSASDIDLSVLATFPQLLKDVSLSTGAGWFVKKPIIKQAKPVIVSCSTAKQVYRQLETPGAVTIRLTSKKYSLVKPFLITKPVQFTGPKNSPITFNTENILAVFMIGGKGKLSLSGLEIDGAGIKAKHFITSDSTGSSEHYNLTVTNSSIDNLDRKNGCENIFYAYKYMLADSIMFSHNSFANNTCNFFMMADEKEDKGYYNAEKIFIGHNSFRSHNGSLLNIYRGGNDESTLGPDLTFSHNKIFNAQTSDTTALIELTGVQLTRIFSNHFFECNPSNILIRYTDKVRARHIFEKNVITNSGSIDKNNFVTLNDNTIN
jgi:poly(beta-D-mannuronate) lyase